MPLAHPLTTARRPSLEVFVLIKTGPGTEHREWQRESVVRVVDSEGDRVVVEDVPDRDGDPRRRNAVRATVGKLLHRRRAGKKQDNSQAVSGRFDAIVVRDDFPLVNRVLVLGVLGPHFESVMEIKNHPSSRIGVDRGVELPK